MISRQHSLFVFILFLAPTIAFAAPVPSDIEADFLRHREACNCFEGATDEPSCGGNGITVYVLRSQVRKIEYGIETSQRSILRDIYFDHRGPVLVVERVYLLLDDHAYRLKKPKLESENRYWLTEDALRLPTVKSAELARQTGMLLHYFQSHPKAFKLMGTSKAVKTEKANSKPLPDYSRMLPDCYVRFLEFASGMAQFGIVIGILCAALVGGIISWMRSRSIRMVLRAVWLGSFPAAITATLIGIGFVIIGLSSFKPDAKGGYEMPNWFFFVQIISVIVAGVVGAMLGLWCLRRSRTRAHLILSMLGWMALGGSLGAIAILEPSFEGYYVIDGNNTLLKVLLLGLLVGGVSGCVWRLVSEMFFQKVDMVRPVKVSG